MRHVDDAHDAKGNRQSDGDQHEHGAEAQSKKHCLDARIERAPPADGLHRSRGRLPHALVALDEAAVGRLFEQSLQLVQHILADAVAERVDRGETRLGIRTIERGERQSRGNFILDLGIGFHGGAIAQELHIAFVQVLFHLCTASKRTDGSALDKPKRASVVCKTRRKWLLVPILVSAIDSWPNQQV